MDKELKDMLLRSLQHTIAIEEKVEKLEKVIYTLLKKEYPLERCSEIVKQQKLITTKTITKDPILKTKYSKYRYEANNLLTEFLESDKDLMEYRNGNKRYVFFEKDKDFVLNTIKINKAIKQKQKVTGRSSYDNVKNYLLSLEKDIIYLSEASEILIKNYNIIDLRRRSSYLKRLVEEGVIIKWTPGLKATFEQ